MGAFQSLKWHYFYRKASHYEAGVDKLKILLYHFVELFVHLLLACNKLTQIVRLRKQISTLLFEI